jgi:hypothetical protein
VVLPAVLVDDDGGEGEEERVLVTIVEEDASRVGSAELG